MGKPENPPAFPLRARGDGSIFERSHEGMTLRDWFAGQALAGMMANQAMLNATLRKTQTGESVADWTAKGAYAVADAMLAERERQP
jgi:hypothetical protein